MSKLSVSKISIQGFLAKKPKSKTGQWNKISNTGTVVKGKMIRCKMRGNQHLVFDKHRNDAYLLVCQPPGSGKSTLIKFIHSHDLLQQLNQKVIVAIPQTIIGKTFQKVQLDFTDVNGKLADGAIQKEIEWEIGNDLCEESSSDKVNRIIAFLKRKKFSKDVAERVLLCTHAALAAAFQKISGNAHLQELFHDTTVVIDEAHHVLNTKTSDNLEIANKIGDLVRFLLATKPQNSKVWFTTATYFRGDRQDILPKEVFEKQFEYHFLPFDIHWAENIRYIKSYSFDFVPFKGDPYDEVRMILAAQKKKTIIYIKGNYKTGTDKYQRRDHLMKIIESAWPGARVLDLVDEAGRDERKKKLLDEVTASEIDVVLAVAIFNEGADWPDAEQIFDLAYTKSLRILVQRFGRIVRDKQGKNHLNYYLFIPFVMEQVTEEDEYRRKLNNAFAAFTASLLLENVIKPVRLPMPKTPGDGGKRYGAGGSVLDHLFRGNLSKQESFIKDCVTSLLYDKSNFDNAGLHYGKKDAKGTLEGVARQCQHPKIDEQDIESVIKAITILLRRRAIPDFGHDVSFVVDAGFEKIWNDKILDGLMGFVSGICGIKTFDDFRRAYMTGDDIIWMENYNKLKVYLDNQKGGKKKVKK